MLVYPDINPAENRLKLLSAITVDHVITALTRLLETGSVDRRKTHFF